MMIDTINFLVETVINNYLRLDKNITTHYQSLVGKVIKVEIKTPELSFFLIFRPDYIDVKKNYSRAVDTTLKASLTTFIKLLKSKDKNLLFLKEKLIVTGDLELAQHVKEVFDKIDIDWEEYLSKAVGDVMAHQLVNTFKKLKDWNHQTYKSLEKSILEFLQEEARLLVPHLELIIFAEDVDLIRDDVERIQARVQRLMRNYSCEA